MKKLIAALTLAMLLQAVSGAMAQVYPARPITLIVPFPAGSPSDVVGRILGSAMRSSLGQPVVVEDIGGAGGTIVLCGTSSP